MSCFFNYDAPWVAKMYDKERCAFGTDVIAGLLHVHTGKPLKTIHLFDAGCGTGNYAKEMVDLGIGKVTLADANSGMLSVAREKLKHDIEAGVVDEVKEAKFPPFPYPDGTFDAVMFNQVLHHLDKNRDGTDYPVLEKTLEETKRGLRPKGMLIITTCLPSTIKEAVWFHKIHPGITQKLQKAFISAEQYQNLFYKYGFECVSAMNLLSASKQTPFVNHFDAEGPLKEEWRKGTNAYAVASEDELKELEKRLLDIKETGSLCQFMMEHDKTLEMGVLAVFVCISL